MVPTELRSISADKFANLYYFLKCFLLIDLRRIHNPNLSAERNDDFFLKMEQSIKFTTFSYRKMAVRRKQKYPMQRMRAEQKRLLNLRFKFKEIITRSNV